MPFSVLINKIQLLKKINCPCKCKKLNEWVLKDISKQNPLSDLL